jgi:hypothetical protein
MFFLYTDPKYSHRPALSSSSSHIPPPPPPPPPPPSKQGELAGRLFSAIFLLVHGSLSFMLHLSVNYFMSIFLSLSKRAGPYEKMSKCTKTTYYKCDCWIMKRTVICRWKIQALVWYFNLKIIRVEKYFAVALKHFVGFFWSCLCKWNIFECM